MGWAGLPHPESIGQMIGGAPRTPLAIQATRAMYTGAREGQYLATGGRGCIILHPLPG